MLRNMVNTMVNLVRTEQNVAPAQIMNLTTSPAKKSKFDVQTNRIVWVDLEMTGLDVEKDTIMEVACIVTDQELNVVAEGPDIIIHHPQNILDNMNEWCRNQHSKSGLTDACLKSSVSLKEAENKVLEFLSEHVAEKVSPLAGNSVYMDRLFINKYMPRVHNYLHYRIIDVSTVKELCRRWNQEVYRAGPTKGLSHRALSDIKESIEELKFYKSNFFKLP